MNDPRFEPAARAPEGPQAEWWLRLARGARGGLSEEIGAASGGNPSGTASLGHLVVPGELDLSHGTVLYLEDVVVSFDGAPALGARIK